MVLTLAHTSLSEKALEPFDCSPDPCTGTYYMDSIGHENSTKSDRLECWALTRTDVSLDAIDGVTNVEWIRLAVGGALCFLLYGVGWPLFLFHYLRTRQDHIAKDVFDEWVRQCTLNTGCFAH